jgi:ATP-binding cassette subfamily C (CFTR/MRP) protein 1
LVAISLATNGVLAVLLIPLSFMYYDIQRIFRKTNTTIARLESVTRSPIYADFSEILGGLGTIRAFREERMFIKKLEEAVNRNTAPLMLQSQAGYWLGIRLDAMGSLITFFVAFLAVACDTMLSQYVGDNFISAGYLALGLTYSFSLTASLKFCIRSSASLEAQMNSVERVKHYSENLAQEEETIGDPAPLPSGWPAEGRVEARDVQMRYRDGPLVLKGLTFSVDKEQKVGVAGRTGSGKSSLMNALFRIEKLSSGSILIDGIDTKSVPLHILRSRLGIIPQDPVMFSASIRFNLDPFSNHTDIELWEILQRVNMKNHVLSLPNELEEVVAEGGDNFSAGQRQLICIGRALLRKPKILVMDEATASIDNETDSLIQEVVRSIFKKSTVLTIAHRLNTIIDSDRIMVLEAGKLGEMGSPKELLAKKDGLFKSLWNRHQESHNEEKEL